MGEYGRRTGQVRSEYDCVANIYGFNECQKPHKSLSYDSLG